MGAGAQDFCSARAELCGLGGGSSKIEIKVKSPGLRPRGRWGHPPLHDLGD
jgi:hypothetical protein